MKMAHRGTSFSATTALCLIAVGICPNDIGAF